MVSGINKCMPVYFGTTRFVSKPKSNDSTTATTNQNSFALYDAGLCALNKCFINFKSYNGDQQPLKKLFYNIAKRDTVYEDDVTNQHLYQVGTKKWVNIQPNELLKRPMEETLQSILTLTKPPAQYPGIPPCIMSPKIGGDESDKWGRHANYIEINPRIVAKYENGRLSEGLFGVMKLMTALPPSSDKIANCIVLSQLYPSFYNDGSIDNDGLYRVRMHEGISNNLTSEGLYAKMGADEQVKAFNDAAHLMGFKTGMRMPLSEGQLKIHDENFDWWHEGHERSFIDACKWAIELGFDSIYFDSAKHVANPDGYRGQGKVPDFFQMQRITKTIRDETGRNDLSFVGEKCNDDDVYRRMGINAGTDWGKADDFESVRWESQKQAPNRDYAGGPEVSNDNDLGWISYEDRINRTKSCLFANDCVENKLPTYFQINDFFPLNSDTNTHSLMEYPFQAKNSGAWTECERHWDGIFNNEWYARNYTQAIYHEFEHAMYR